MIVGTVLALAAGYGSICLLTWLRQDGLIYFPDRTIRVTPSDMGVRFEDQEIATADGERLHAWVVPADDPQAPWVLFCHGNAGNLSNRVERAVVFHRMGVNALLFDYRGYGRSTGTPSEAGLTRDAVACWNWLVTARNVPPARIVVMGESLGGGVATALAVQHQPAGLILESTFTSAVDLGAEVYPWLPVRLLSRNRFESRDRLARIAGPKLFLHSPEDDVIPYRHGRALYEAAPEPKEFADLSGGHNVGTLAQGPTYVATVSDFLGRVASMTPPPSTSSRR